MNSGITPNPEPAYWLVGAFTDADQSDAWVQAGIWRNGYGTKKYADLVRQMRTGDRIAIKASSVQKNGLPFDNNGRPASFMDIKAIGTVVAPTTDGHTVQVRWEPVQPPRRWYHNTYRNTIQRLDLEKPPNRDLIDFIFYGKPQDLSRPPEDPSETDKTEQESGDPKGPMFTWVEPYQRLADGLLPYRKCRAELVQRIRERASEQEYLSYLKDTWPDGRTGFPDDLDPFTIFSAFNRPLKDENRIALFESIASALDITVPTPRDFSGIPPKNLLNARFVWDSTKRGKDDIENLWEVFESALEFSGRHSNDHRARFIQAYDRVIDMLGINRGLTFGLFWIRPNTFVSLDKHMLRFLENILHIPVPRSGAKKLPTGAEYLHFVEQVHQHIAQTGDPTLSIPRLSHEARRDHQAQAEDNDHDLTGDELPPPTRADNQPASANQSVIPPTPAKPYSIESITADGCFVQPVELQKLLNRLREKKNLILQGPPGTGKTWLAKRLAYALIGSKNPDLVPSVQFHPNLAYEDFICGWRPGGQDGRLNLVDGPFLEAARQAHRLHDEHGPDAPPVVLIIEEINRGNPAQIFGEMLTLLESTKRRPDQALRLANRPAHEDRFWLPPNFHIIGTMNVADRSLAIVDFALRRRFAFASLNPCFNELWYNYVTAKRHMPPDLARSIASIMDGLNRFISTHKTLGAQFQIGHSYFTPGTDTRTESWDRAAWLEWLEGVVTTDMEPLLQEYLFDDADAVRAEIARFSPLLQ